MYKRFVGLTLCICLLAGILIGCGAEKERTLIFIHWDVKNKEVYETLAKEYMNVHKGLTVEVQLISPEEYTDILLQSFSDKNISDVFAVPVDEDFEAFINSGKLRDLNNRKVLPDDYNSALLQIGTREGHVWAIPVTGSVPVVFYNKTLFQQYGLVQPRTISDFVVNCLILQEKNILPFAMSRDNKGVLNTGDFVEGILANGPCDTGLMSDGEFFNENTELDSGFYDTVGLAFELTMGDLTVKKEESVEGHQKLLEQFANGTCAMFPGSSNDIEKLRELNCDFDFGFFSMPGADNSHIGVFKADMMLGISKSSKVTSDAEGFINYMLSAEGQNLLCNEVGRIPVTNHVTILDPDLAAAQGFLNTPDGMYPSIFQRISNDERAICFEKLDIVFSDSNIVLDDYMLDWAIKLKEIQ